MLLSASENEMTVPFFTTSSSRHDVAINESVTPKQRAAHTFFNEIFLLILLFITSTVFLLCHRRGTFNPLRLFVVRFRQLPIGRTRSVRLLLLNHVNGWVGTFCEVVNSYAKFDSSEYRIAFRVNTTIATFCEVEGINVALALFPNGSCRNANCDVFCWSCSAIPYNST